jgi:23S rRNA (uracil1939-C5)-methyltransferase
MLLVSEVAAAAADALPIGRVADATADGRGIIRDAGKTVFLDGAIIGELVRYRLRKRRRKHDDAELVDVLEPSPDRVMPRCAVFGLCGGCALQHLDSGAQLRLKESVLLDNLQRLGGVMPERILPPISGPPWAYRRKARLAVKYVARKGRVLVGFRERHAPYVTDAARCETLHPAVGGRLADLATLIQGLSLRERIPQIEVGVGDDAVALVFRVLEAPSEADLERLRTFAHETDFDIYLQTGGANSIAALPGARPPRRLNYALPGVSADIEFQPADFIQVNQAVNQKMVTEALELLSPSPDSRVLDLYCGLGNFTLAVARRAAMVTGIEGSVAMVGRAAANAARAGVENVQFVAGDLARPDALDAFAGEAIHRVLLDPPRSGAAAVLDAVAAFAPARIVYVSCHPGTLARDAQRLTSKLGYTLAAAGVMDMFPQTAHIESMALFTRGPADD